MAFGPELPQEIYEIEEECDAADYFDDPEPGETTWVERSSCANLKIATRNYEELVKQNPNAKLRVVRVVTTDVTDEILKQKVS